MLALPEPEDELLEDELLELEDELELLLELLELLEELLELDDELLLELEEEAVPPLHTAPVTVGVSTAPPLAFPNTPNSTL